MKPGTGICIAVALVILVGSVLQAREKVPQQGLYEDLEAKSGKAAIGIIGVFVSFFIFFIALVVQYL